MSSLERVSWVVLATWKMYLFLNEQLLSCDKKYRDIFAHDEILCHYRTKPMATRHHQQHQVRAEISLMLPPTTTITTVSHLLLNWMPWMLNSTILLSLSTHRSAIFFSVSTTQPSRMNGDFWYLESKIFWILDLRSLNFELTFLDIKLINILFLQENVEDFLNQQAEVLANGVKG